MGRTKIKKARMRQQRAQDKADAQANEQRLKESPSKPVLNGAGIIGFVGGACWIIADLSGHWHERWVMYIAIPAFVLGCARLAYELVAHHIHARLAISYGSALLALLALPVAIVLCYRFEPFGQPEPPQVITSTPSSQPVARIGMTEESPRLSGPLTPSNEPYPAPLAKMIAEASPPAFRQRIERPGVLKVYMGSLLVFTEFPVCILIRIDDRDLLEFHRGPKGIAVDAQILDDNGTVIAQIEDNEFFINKDNYFRMSGGAHSLNVFDRSADPVLRVRYINPSTLTLSGRFRFHGRSVAVGNFRVIADNGTNTRDIELWQNYIADFIGPILDIQPDHIGICRVNELPWVLPQTQPQTQPVH